WEIIQAKESEINPAICALPPVFLDELFMKKLDAKLLWGYDLIPHPYLVTIKRQILPSQVLSTKVPLECCFNLNGLSLTHESSVGLEVG
ncbi:MAG TPA: hypothetical protein VFQ47_05895, partial [Nitrososphaera sp.]|nr:hypothetical protein [Nitrososphaera sp.]